jgi:hypothetical protein
VINNNNLIQILITYGSRYSAVGIATGYELDSREVGVLVPEASRVFSTSMLALRTTQPPIRWIPEGGVERPVNEADHSPPTTAETKNTWTYAPTPPFVLIE